MKFHRPELIRRHKLVRNSCAAILLVGLMTTATAQESPTNGLPRAQYTAEGTERCLRCHAGERMTLMADTVHGNPANPDTPYARHGCESCHGPGSLHASRARGGRGFPPLVTFQRGESVQAQTDACAGCHATDMGDLPGMEWTGSAHDAHKMTCIDCHKAHVIGNPLAGQKQQQQSCAKCHKKQITSHPRFEDKGIDFDKLSCYDCHDVHQLQREP